ncbi:probable glutamate carboxypeptidase LAMP1 isoform X1 [Triticum aestivum]|uniref:probable glutamate carboxypeptidase LAMP1 isoform X1 n=1 Tax=Triticum aestivum TaxID=4565 RepID=UPI001D01B93D|nr:probable glutamate carboxypeptidase LAMP1 isoform X1 [Triticum aestivum]
MLILFFLLITRWSKSQNILFFQFMKVQDPDNSSQTAYDSWVKSNASPNIQRLGNGGSDYAAFVQHVGIPSTNLIFGEGPGYPVYHSLYDDFVRVEKFADPGFCRHVAAASRCSINDNSAALLVFLSFYYLACYNATASSLYRKFE